MNLFLIGKDYKSADIKTREGLYLNRKSIQEYFSGSSILATCNRFEIYGQGEVPQPLPSSLLGSQIIIGKPGVFRHALRVACGIESQVIGETEILQQLSKWIEKESIPEEVRQLWIRALKCAKEIRLLSRLNDSGRNIATVIFRLLAKKNRPQEIIIAGTGKVAGLFIINKPEWATINFAAHKNRKQAEFLANRSQGHVLNFEELKSALIEADILISASSSPHLIFKKEYLQKIVLARKDQLVIFDLAIPRDVDPIAKEINGLILYDLDDLSEMIEEFNVEIKSQIAFAEYLIEEKAKEYEKYIKSWHAVKPVSLKTS